MIICISFILGFDLVRLINRAFWFSIAPLASTGCGVLAYYPSPGIVVSQFIQIIMGGGELQRKKKTFGHTNNMTTNYSNSSEKKGKSHANLSFCRPKREGAQEETRHGIQERVVFEDSLLFSS